MLDLCKATTGTIRTVLLVAVLATATAAFAQWHLVSLLLSFVTVALAGVALALVAKLPTTNRAATEGGPYQPKP